MVPTYIKEYILEALSNFPYIAKISLHFDTC